ncbi:kinase-like domain-containing protein [Mycena vitilis]|nr:kinase-like domain-containing protein [Mycena vitilis]
MAEPALAAAESRPESGQLKPPMMKPQPFVGAHVLRAGEVFWYNHRDWLKSKGYVLRPRYQEGWKASWTLGNGKRKFSNRYEDGALHMRVSIMDATRVEDGAFVVLKKINTKDHPYEVKIGTYFSEQPQRSDPENHCVPILEVLQSPHRSKIQIIVMPLLQRFDKPRFDSIGETIAFFRQIFIGLRYMHRHGVAHRDCARYNIMMDGSPLYSTPMHPVDNTMKRDWSGRVSHKSRAEHPVKYYLTDFGISRHYRPEALPTVEAPILGADKSVPEFQIKNNEDPPDCDPFPTDVYYLGNLLREDFTEGGPYVLQKIGFEFMNQLVTDMVNTDPSKRPTMEEVVDRFEDLVRGMSNWKLRSQVAKKQHFRFLYTLSHCMLTVRLIAGRKPAIPMP